MLDKLTYANVVSTLCLFLVLGGTAYAAATITGAEVVDNSLTGADVYEATLAGVNADKVDGIDSTGFVQGRGRLVSNRLVRPADGPSSQLLNVPGLGELWTACYRTKAEIHFYNTSAGPLDMWKTTETGTRGTILERGRIELAADDVTSTDDSDGVTLQLGQGNDPGARTVATIQVSVYQSADNAPCGFQVQGTVWTS